MRSMKTLKIAVVAQVALMLLGCFELAQSSTATALTPIEMRRTVGTNAQAGKCSETCARYNDYQEECIGEADGVLCTMCKNNSTVIYRLNQASGACPAGIKGYQRDPAGNSTDCGLVQDGKCKSNVCNLTSTSQKSCNDPINIIVQP